MFGWSLKHKDCGHRSVGFSFGLVVQIGKDVATFVSENMQCHSKQFFWFQNSSAFNRDCDENQQTITHTHFFFREFDDDGGWLIKMEMVVVVVKDSQMK